MKHKLLYIIALILTIETLCFILLDKQTAATISTLTQQTTSLTSTVDKLTTDNEALQANVESLQAKMRQYEAEADKLSTDKEIEIFVEAIDPNETGDITETIASARRRLNGIDYKM